MITKKAFAEMIRMLKTTDPNTSEFESVLDVLSEDLGYIEILALAYPETELLKLEASDDDLWSDTGKYTND